MGAAFAAMFALARRRRFAGFVLTSSFASAAVFAYIAGASFVFAGRFGFPPVMVSVVFGVNAAGNLAGALLFRYLAGRVPTPRVVWSALGVATSAVVALTALATVDSVPAPIVWAALLVALTAFGVLFPAVTTEGQNAGRTAPGGASALLGAGQFTVGAAVSPTVGAFDASSALPLAAIMTACFLLATGSYLLTRDVSGCRRTQPTGVESRSELATASEAQVSGRGAGLTDRGRLCLEAARPAGREHDGAGAPGGGKVAGLVAEDNR